MKYLSVCSGIEAATVAWKPLGWEAVGFSEIEKFPSAVLQHHYPDVPNHGDMNDFKRWPNTDIDVLVGGTPCQSFSVAGLRKGMADPRGNLALVYLAIAQHCRPNWLVWENVPGVLSSNEGRDFGSIIGAMVKLGYGIAYRVLNAQHFGVPQRRRRVFVIGYLGDWRRAAEVLFNPESLRRNHPPRRGKGQNVAGTVTRSALDGGSACGGDGREGLMVPEISKCLIAGAGTRLDSETETFIPISEFAHDIDGHGSYIPEVANPLTARMHKIINSNVCENQTPIVTHTLRGEGFDASEDGTGRGIPLVVHSSPDVAAPLTAGSSRPGVNPPGRRKEDDENLIAFAQNQRDEVRLMDCAGALAVRRLTPLECTRLQGFPDDYFDDVPGRSDSAVYKALGNSMAVPCMQWIGERIQKVNTHD